jgi:type I restriction enzyme R subunit
MTRLTESAIEDLAIDQLEAQGYRYLAGPNIAHDGETPERESYEDVLLPKLMSGEVHVIP